MRRAILVAALVIAATACSPTTSSGSGGTSASSSGGRPTTPATLSIVQPTPNQVITGTTVHLVLQLANAVVVQPGSVLPINPGQGHIHVSLDGKLISMVYGTTQDIPDVPPGAHSISAAFVASDHLPFANQVVATVLFTVSS